MINVKNKKLLSGFGAVAVLTFASLVNAAPISVIDDRGSHVTLPETAKSVASISYFAADTVIALGGKPVASTYMLKDRNPDYLLDYLSGVLEIGQRAAPNLEMLADAKPDLIVAIRRYTEANATQLNAIAPYLALSLETFSDSDRSIQLLGGLLGKSQQAAKLNADFHQDLDHFVKDTEAKERVKYLFIWGGGEAPWAFYNENMTAAIITALGGKNVAGSNPTPHVPDNTAFEMSLESILVANPDVIFVYDYGPDRPFESNPVWSQLNAVKNNRVYFVKDHWVESHGPIARQMVLRESAHLLYPEEFPEFNLKDEVERFLSAGLKG